MSESDPSTAIDARTCLIVMLKAPARSKRRLAREIGPLALEAAERLAECALEDARRWPGAVCYAPASAADGAWLGRREGPRAAGTPAARGEPAAQIVVQPHGNLGQRINHVSDTLWSRGFEQQVFIGTDCPQLDLDHLAEAVRRLAEHDAVLGPARDGGVVLMAARRPWPDLTHLPWSTHRLMDSLDALCRASGWTTAFLEPLLDVDSLADLYAVAGGLERDARPARRALAEWLSAHRTALEATG